MTEVPDWPLRPEGEVPASGPQAPRRAPTPLERVAELRREVDRCFQGSTPGGSKYVVGKPGERALVLEVRAAAIDICENLKELARAVHEAARQ